jgi:hypothetical protein
MTKCRNIYCSAIKPDDYCTVSIDAASADQCSWWLPKPDKPVQHGRCVDCGAANADNLCVHLYTDKDGKTLHAGECRGWVPETPAKPAGRKDDAGKPRMDLIAPEFLFAVAMVLEFGARKYHDRNWEHGMSWGRCYSACLRHLLSWWGGAGPTTKSFLFGELDTETGFSHLWHAACCVMFLLTYEERSVGTDDRWKGVPK